MDLRDFIKKCEGEGELKRIKAEVDWDLEMGAISELVHGRGKAKEPRPVLLFDDIPGYPKHYRTLFGMLDSTWRMATITSFST
jgi:4-hydroxy-3-polyprenylbenzoate decarboxylase